MAGDGPSDRFEYLFDPTAGETTTTEAPAVEPFVSEPQSPQRPRSLLLLAAATVAGAAFGCVLPWPEPVDAGATSPNAPATRPSQPPAPTRAVEQPSGPAAVPPPLQSADAPTAPAQAPRLQPSSNPPSTRPPPPQPTVRAPISVSPAPRPAFPNQNPDTGNGGGRSGLLGGGGLL